MPKDIKDAKIEQLEHTIHCLSQMAFSLKEEVEELKLQRDKALKDLVRAIVDADTKDIDF